MNLGGGMHDDSRVVARLNPDRLRAKLEIIYQKLLDKISEEKLRTTKNEERSTEIKQKITKELLAQDPRKFWEQTIDSRVRGMLSKRGDKKANSNQFDVDYQSLAQLGRQPTEAEVLAAISTRTVDSKNGSGPRGSGGTIGKNSQVKGKTAAGKTGKGKGKSPAPKTKGVKPKGGKSARPTSQATSGKGKGGAPGGQPSAGRDDTKSKGKGKNKSMSATRFNAKPGTKNGGKDSSGKGKRGRIRTPSRV